MMNDQEDDVVITKEEYEQYSDIVEFIISHSHVARMRSSDEPLHILEGFLSKIRFYERALNIIEETVSDALR